MREALERLSRKGWVRLASGAGSRAVKYRHLLDDSLELDDPEIALLTVLMLRGPQTPGELKQRIERLHSFAPGEVEETLARLIERELAARLPRRPGQKEERYVQLLGGETETLGEEPGSDPVRSQTPETPDRMGEFEARLARLEAAFDDLRAQFDA